MIEALPRRAAGGPGRARVEEPAGEVVEGRSFTSCRRPELCCGALEHLVERGEQGVVELGHRHRQAEIDQRGDAVARRCRRARCRRSAPGRASTLIAMPWNVTQWRMRTPMAAILSSRPPPARHPDADPARRAARRATPKRGSARISHSSSSETKRRTSRPRASQVEHDIDHALARPVIGVLAAAPGEVDRKAAGRQQIAVAWRWCPRCRAADAPAARPARRACRRGSPRRAPPCGERLGVGHRPLVDAPFDAAQLAAAPAALESAWRQFAIPSSRLRRPRGLPIVRSWRNW